MKKRHTMDFMQVKDLSFDERVKMYMRLRKDELARMLAQRDDYEKMVQPIIYPTGLQENTEIKRCRDWSDCTNPCYDCINCPVREPIGMNQIRPF